MKKGILLLTVLTLSTSFISPFMANSDSNVNDQRLKSANINRNYVKNDNVVNLTKLLCDGAINAYKAMGLAKSDYLIPKLSPVGMNISDVSITPNGDPKIDENTDAIFMGQNEFDNYLDYAVTKNTLNYSKTVTNTTTTEVTWGLDQDISGDYEIFGQDFIFEYSKTNTNTKSTSVTVTAPSQLVQVPPHSKAIVKVFLGQNSTKINLFLNAKISGKLVGYIEDDGDPYNFSIDMVTALSYIPNLPKGVSVDLDNDQIIFKGAAIAENVEQSNIFTVTEDTYPL